MMMKRKLYTLTLLLALGNLSFLYAQNKSRPIVNQAGCNLGEAKRFVCYGAEDGSTFEILRHKDLVSENPAVLYKGTIRSNAGDFSDFNPQKAVEEFVVRVPGHGDSRVVRYWVNSKKWVDIGWQEFNEMGNVFGQAVFRNLFMYLCEKNEPDGQPEKFLAYARTAADDMIQNWDFNNPRHMWWIRNGEHITPQALAFFLLVAPESAPYGTKEKLIAWSNHIKEKTNNF